MAVDLPSTPEESIETLGNDVHARIANAIESAEAESVRCDRLIREYLARRRVRFPGPAILLDTLPA